MTSKVTSQIETQYLHPNKPQRLSVSEKTIDYRTSSPSSESDPFFEETCLYKKIKEKKDSAGSSVAKDSAGSSVAKDNAANIPAKDNAGNVKEKISNTTDVLEEPALHDITLQDGIALKEKKTKNKHCTINSFAIIGLETPTVTIEASVSPGLARFDIIGLGDTAVKEARERVTKAITQCGYSIPSGNITINLAPAKMRKKGSIYDLPIALALLYASGQIHSQIPLQNIVVAGELSLSGKVRDVEGVYCRLLASLMEKEKQELQFIIPKDNLLELYQLKNKITHQIKSVSSLKESIDYLAGNAAPPTLKQQIDQAKSSDCVVEGNIEALDKNLEAGKKDEIGDFSEIVGQDTAKLALQLSVIANLNVLFIGPPGSGKSMLMRRMPSILPNLNEDQSLMLTRIEHACGIRNHNLIRQMPFREVHSGIPVTSLMGGGRIPKPGEISLAHKGFLFMDEISLFPQASLQCLRTPIEQKKITLNRLSSNITYPCDFTLLACCNPCPCGFYGDPDKICKCSKAEVNRFFSRLCEPFVDRFDIILYIGKIVKQDFDRSTGESSVLIKQRIEKIIREKDKITPFYRGKKISDILREHPLIKELVLRAIEKDVISLRRVKSMLKVLQAMMMYEARDYDRLMLLRAMDLACNKLKK